MIRIALLMGMLALPYAAAAFTDVHAAHESRRAIDYLQREGVLQGYADGTFKPAFPINRAELLKVLVVGKGVDPALLPQGGCFPDVADEWYAPYVCHAWQRGWVHGYGDGTFKPERQVSFVEALKMLGNARGYPQAPAEESMRRGIDSSSWFAPYLTTALLIDVVSYDQVWGPKAIPLHAGLSRGAVAQLLYRSLMAEGALRMPLFSFNCPIAPSAIEVRTYVDVVVATKTNVFRQDVHGVDDAGGSCLLGTDVNPFGRVAAPLDAFFLQPYPAGQPKNEWTARIQLRNGRAILRGGKLDGTFRPEVFVADIVSNTLRQLPSVYASPGGSIESGDRRYIAFIGATGRTLEAIDLDAGGHLILDAVDEPRTFLASGAAHISFFPAGSNVVSYAVYAGSGPAEPRTVDLDAAFGPAVPSDPFAPIPDDPFSQFGTPPTMVP